MHKEEDFNLSELFQAYYDCRKRKRNKNVQIDFEQNMERNLCELKERLNDRTYEVDRSRVFVVESPKYREVWAGRFPDRVIQHVMYNRIFERFYKKFIYDSYACIPERGVLFGANRVHKMMAKATEGWQKNAYVLQADLANFFVSINKNILKELTLKEIPESELRWLSTMIIDADPTDNPIIKSPPELFDKIPPHKSLFNAPQHKGLPIGNLSSQYLANVYLNKMDQFVKRHLKVKFYGRYVDDIVMIGDSIQELNEKFEELCYFVEEELDIQFHPNKTRRGLVFDGINFCGYILKPHRKYVRKSTMHSLNKIITHQDSLEKDQLKQRVNSYLGHMIHANTYHQRKQIAIDTNKWFNSSLTKITR